MGMNVGSSSGLNSDINVTPLVDVVLVLLIIFMLVTPLIDDGPLRLPQTSHPALKGEQPDRIVVAVGADRTAWVDGSRILDDELTPRIKNAFQNAPQTQVILKADSHLTYGDVKKTMLRIREAGVEQIGVMARQKDIT